MDGALRIERKLEAALATSASASAPPILAKAVHHAVFPGGARVRPQICLAVAKACGDLHPELVDAAAASIELMHCASLVHDDLPCFDNAETRRGTPSVHKAFGEPIAVLAGDALIVLAFETVMSAAPADRVLAVMRVIGQSVGMPFGIVAGQAWESEPRAVLEDYQRAKTGSLFSAATTAGALAAGADPEAWSPLGAYLGEAYQVADDIRDVAASTDDMGKPAGQDEALKRPNAALQFGLEAAVEKLEQLVADAVASIPSCPGADALRDLVILQKKRLVPKALAKSAA